MKRTLRAAVMLLGLLGACDLVPPGEEAYIDYSSRVVDISDVLDLAARDFRLRETQVYGSTGKLGGRFVQGYDAEGLNNEVHVYAVDDEGNSVLTEHQVITRDPATDMETLNESFDSDDVRQSWAATTYHAPPLDTAYVLWQLWVWDPGTEADILQSERRATYLTAQADPDLEGRLRTVQLFSRDSEGVMKLTSESAFWYDAAGLLLAQLDHVLRGTDDVDEAVLPEGVDERYFYSAYSRNPQDQVFSKIQYLYEDALIPRDADLSFTLTPANPDPLAYSIDNDGVRYQVGMEISDYDGQGNLVRETVYSFGEIQEVRTYAWLEPGFETERARYVNGGTVLDEKVVTRYRVEDIGGAECWVKEAFTYYTDDREDDQ